MITKSHSCQSINGDDILPEVVSLISGKWKSRIIYSLMISDKKYSELKMDIPETSDRMLSKNLRDLIESGMINKIAVSITPLEIKYTLSDSGKKISPVIISLLSWGRFFLNNNNIQHK